MTARLELEIEAPYSSRLIVWNAFKGVVNGGVGRGLRVACVAHTCDPR